MYSLYIGLNYYSWVSKESILVLSLILFGKCTCLMLINRFHFSFHLFEVIHPKCCYIVVRTKKSPMR